MYDFPIDTELFNIVPKQLMRHRSNHAEQALSNAQNNEVAGQPRTAFDVCESYFYKCHAKQWDSIHERLLKLSLKLGSDLMLVPEKAIEIAIKIGEINTEDKVSEYFHEYIEMCHERVKIDKTIAETEAKQCSSQLLCQVDLNKLVREVIVDPAMIFLFRSYTYILEKLQKTIKFENLFHEILEESVSFSVKEQRSDILSDLCFQLTRFRGHAESSKVINIIKVIDSEIICYKACIKLGKFELALESINDAFLLANKNESRASKELIRDIEKYKLEVLQITGRKLFSAIQRQNLRQYTPSEERKVFIETVMMETASAPIFEESLVPSNKVNFPQFLKQTSGIIPNRNQVLTNLLASTDNIQNSKLDIFVHAAEYSSDPYDISNKFEEFRKSKDLLVDDQTLYDLCQYAAIRTLQKCSIHYSTISFTEISKIVPWLKIEQIELLLVDASRSALIPAHIDMKKQCVHLVTRGNQELQPTLSLLNDQLKATFHHFQGISHQFLDHEKSSEKTVGSYNRPEVRAKMINRSSEIKHYKNLISEAKLKEQKKRDDEIAKRREEEAAWERQIREEEAPWKRQNIGEEETKSIERKRRIESFERILFESELIADEMNIDIEELLSIPTSHGLRATGNKAADLEFIEDFCHDLKVNYVNMMKTRSQEVQEQIFTEKPKIGKSKIINRLVIKKRAQVQIEKEFIYIQKAIEKQNKDRQKLYSEELKIYQAMKKNCEQIMNTAESKDLPKHLNKNNFKKPSSEIKKEDPVTKPKTEVVAEIKKEDPVTKPKTEVVAEIKKEPVAEPKTEVVAETKKISVLHINEINNEPKKPQNLERTPERVPKISNAWGKVDIHPRVDEIKSQAPKNPQISSLNNNFEEMITFPSNRSNYTLSTQDKSIFASMFMKQSNLYEPTPYRNEMKETQPSRFEKKDQPNPPKYEKNIQPSFRFEKKDLHYPYMNQMNYIQQPNNTIQPEKVDQDSRRHKKKKTHDSFGEKNSGSSNLQKSIPIPKEKEDIKPSSTSWNQVMNMKPKQTSDIIKTNDTNSLDTVPSNGKRDQILEINMKQSKSPPSKNQKKKKPESIFEMTILPSSQPDHSVYCFRLRKGCKPK